MARFELPAAALILALAGALPAAAAPAPAGSTTPAPYMPPAKRVSASDGFAAQMESKTPPPRRADGHPDLSGMWNGGFQTAYGPNTIRATGTSEPDQADVQRSTHWNKPHYKPEYWAKVRSLDYSIVDVDPVYNCGPTGVPRQMAPAKIIQTDKEILLANGDSTRYVPVDGRKRNPEDSDEETFDGIPIGHWEGDVLVVESVGFNDISWLMWQGYFHSESMKVTERIWREGNLLFYNAKVDDPEVLAEPWTTDTVVRKLVADPMARMGEREPCHESDVNLLADKYNRG